MNRRLPVTSPWMSRLLWAAGAASSVAMVLPDLLGLDAFTPFAQVVALRPYLLAILGGVVVILAVPAQWGRRLVPAATTMAVVLAIGVVLVAPRALAAPAPPGGRVLTVATFNTFNGAADVAAVASLVESERPDVMALIEAGASFRSRLAPLVEPLGYRQFTAAGEASGDLGGVTVVVADRLGDVRSAASTANPFPFLQIEAGELGPLRFVAFHALAPRRGDLPQWRSDLGGLARWCAGGTPAIIAGDFNATLDHSLLRSATAGCSDAAAQRGQGLVPTWPTWLPYWLGPQIDHVFATDPITAESFEVHDLPGSDHRAVLARLRLPA